MKRPTRLDDKIRRIRALIDEHPPSALSELRSYLGESNGYLLCEAAKATQKLELRDLIPELSAAFLRLVPLKQEADRGCFGKKALIEALLYFEAPAFDIYLRGLRLIQKEYSFGPPVDSASSLRGLCAFALVQLEFRDALLDVTPLLMDEEPDTRAAAAEALTATGEPAAAALLHLKILAGDQEPDVLGACYKGMLTLAPARYLPLVSTALSQGEEVAAIALGESRLPAAFETLKGAHAINPIPEQSLLLAIALLRLEEANNYLVDQVEKGRESTAINAISALGLQRHDQKLKKRLYDIVGLKHPKSTQLEAALLEQFGEQDE